jgi:putative hydrolase of HD superfamily
MDIDLHKVIMMLVIHELEEIAIGDLTPFDTMSKQERQERGRQAVETILGNLTKKADYLALTDEFNNQTTKEARFARMCDKLEATIQMKRYEEEGAVSLEKGTKNAVEHKSVQKYIQQGAKTLAEVWIEYDR